MKLRTLVLLAILMSCLKLQAQEANPQPLSQFTIDVILNIGLQNGLDTLNKYRESQKFYVSESELFNVGQILYRQNRHNDALDFMKSVRSRFPGLKNSLAQNLFMMILDNGVEKAQEWLHNNPDYNGDYIEESEFDMATTTLLRAGQFEECKVLNSIYLNEFPDNQEAHFQMADICAAEGKVELGKQYFRSGVETEDYISFSKLAADPLSTYLPTVLSSDTTNLFVVDGDVANDTVWLFVQGGPMPDISAYHPRPLSLLPNYEKLLKVDVLQSQMINRSILSADIPLTEIQNLYEHNVSAEMLHRTVEYFKDRGKFVFVIGHSYGAYIAIEYLNSKTNLCDRLIIMAGDLDEDLRNYEMNEDGSRKFIRFRDGVTPYETSFWGNFTMEETFRPKLEKIFTNTGNLVAAHGKRKFSKLLEGKDLSNVIFYHSRFDEANGRTTIEELKFWKDHGAKTIESFGDHHSMLNEQVIANLANYLMGKEMLKRSVASTLTHDISTMGIDKAIINYKSERDRASHFLISETEINTLGYQLISQNKMEAAIKIFQLNVDSFPNSWNAYDSLGETYLAVGNTELARKFYHQSLNIHPGNIYAIMALQQL